MLDMNKQFRYLRICRRNNLKRCILHPLLTLPAHSHVNLVQEQHFVTGLGTEFRWRSYLLPVMYLQYKAINVIFQTI